ncbi:MAG: hypothetical protein CM15mP93_08470 [Thiotrichaceae bacterium]|nr:MAG: hypothetical protein CM15mP93_08470 [Thiotrichaceae bacterium]
MELREQQGIVLKNTNILWHALRKSKMAWWYVDKLSTVKQSIKRLKDLEIEVSKKDSDLTKKNN